MHEQIMELLQLRRMKGKQSADLLPIAVQNKSSINWPAIIAISMVGECFGYETPFNGINTKKDDILPIIDRIEQPSTIDEAYNMYNDLVLHSIKSIPSDIPTVMGLSGGRDSRHILLACQASGRCLPRLVTARHFLGRESEGDVAVAQLLASRLRRTIQVVDQPGDRFHAEWDKNRCTGLQTLAHSWGLALADALDGPEVLLDGMNGGVLFGRSGIMKSVRQKFGSKRPPFPALRDHVVNALIDEPARSLQTWMASPRIIQTMWADMRDQVATNFERYSDYPNPIQAFQYGEHVRRGTRLFTYGMMRNDCVICPLDMPDLVSFALSLPWEISSDPTFQDRAIALCYPDMADIPYTEGVTNLPSPPSLDTQSESKSWKRIRQLLEGHVIEAGMDLLEQSGLRLGTIQKTTMLGQAIYWDEHGVLPDGAIMFGKE